MVRIPLVFSGVLCYASVVLVDRKRLLGEIMDYVYEVIFCRETLMTCSTLDKAEEAVKMLLQKEEFRGFKSDDFFIGTVKLDTY